MINNNLNKSCFQNLSCAFAQVTIKDFEYKKQEVFCLSQITDGKRFGKHPENRKFSVFFVSQKKSKMKQKTNKAGKEM